MKSLISCCATAGIAEWVCCPGVGNGVLLEALSLCPVVHRWTQADDRSAAYFALGRIQATARPVALVAGQGAAAGGAYAAVVEAYYRRCPLLVITMDGEDPAGGCSVPGYVEQENLFGLYAPSVELHVPCAVSDLPDLRGVLQDGFPVHLHVRVGRGVSAGVDYSAIEVADPAPFPAFRGSLVGLSQMLRFRAAQEGLALVVGALEPPEQEPVLWLAQTLRVPVLAEASSGLREELAPYLLRDGDRLLAECPPRYVLRVGDVPTGAFWRSLEHRPDVEVYSVTRTGFSGLSRRSTVIEGELEQVMKALGDVPHVGDTMRLMRRSRQEAGREEELLLAYPESAAALVRALSNQACMADVLVLGSPSAVALWNRFAQMQAPTPYLRDLGAASGADGVASLFFAHSVGASYAVCFAGDIATSKDLSAVAFLPQLPQGKRVFVVLNNEGAGLAFRSGMEAELHRLGVQPPFVDWRDVARFWGAEYYAIRTEADAEVLETLDENSFALLELLPDPDQSECCPA